MLQPRQPHCRRVTGFTLTESAIVLALLSALIGGIWLAALSVRDHMRVNEAAREIGIIVQNMRDLYSEQPTFGNGILTTKMLTANVFPAEIVVNGVPRNPWGTTQALSEIPNGGISIGANVGYGGGPRQLDVLEIVFWGLSRSASIALLSKYIGPGGKGDVVFVYSDGCGMFNNPASVTPNQLTSCLGNTVIYFKK